MEGPERLPSNWTDATLAELGLWSGGGTPSKSRPDFWAEGTIPWVSPKDMGDAVLAGTQDRITASATEKSAARLVPANSIAFVVRSGILTRLLPIAFVPFAAAYNQDMRVLTPAPSLDPYWLLWALRACSEDIRRRCQKQGTTVASIEVPELLEYQLAVPPREEQPRIAEIIERLLGQLDDGREHLDKAHTSVRTYRQSVLVSAVSGRLGVSAPNGRSGSELRAGILARRKGRWLEASMGRYAEAFSPTPPGGVVLPGGWTWATIDELAVGVQYGSSAKTVSEGDVPVLRMGNLVDGLLDLSDLKYLPAEHEEFPGLLLRDGDLLFNRTNSAELVGKTAVARGLPEPCSFASYLIRVRFAPEVEPEFVSWYLNSAFGRAWVRANVSQQVGQANVNGSKLRALTVPLPPVTVQRSLREEVDGLLRASDDVRLSFACQAADLEKLRSSLLLAVSQGQLGTGSARDEHATSLMDCVRRESVAMSSERRRNRKPRRAVPVGE
jgi:type I restriction enzyme S subunit